MQGIELARSLVKDFSEENYILKDTNGNKLLIHSYTIEPGNIPETRKVTYTFENSDEARTLEYPFVGFDQFEDTFYKGEAINLDYCFVDTIDLYDRDEEKHADITTIDISMNAAFVQDSIEIGYGNGATIRLNMNDAVFQGFLIESDGEEVKSALINASNATFIGNCNLGIYSSGYEKSVEINMKNVLFNDGLLGIGPVGNVEIYFDNSIFRPHKDKHFMTHDIDFEGTVIDDGILSFAGCYFTNSVISFYDSMLGSLILDFTGIKCTHSYISIQYASLNGTHIKYDKVEDSNHSITLFNSSLSKVHISFDKSILHNFSIDLNGARIEKSVIDLDNASGSNITVSMDNTINEKDCYIGKYNEIDVDQTRNDFVAKMDNHNKYQVVKKLVHSIDENTKIVTFTLDNKTTFSIEYPIVKWEDIVRKLVNNEAVNIDNCYIENMKFDDIKDKLENVNISARNAFIDSDVHLEQVQMSTVLFDLTGAHIKNFITDDSIINDCSIIFDNLNTYDSKITFTASKIKHINLSVQKCRFKNASIEFTGCKIDNGTINKNDSYFYESHIFFWKTTCYDVEMQVQNCLFASTSFITTGGAFMWVKMYFDGSIIIEENISFSGMYQDFSTSFINSDVSFKECKFYNSIIDVTSTGFQDSNILFGTNKNG